MGSSNRPGDGEMDFGGYADGQLKDLQFTLDREAYPLNYAHLLKELARRGLIHPAGDETAEQAPGRGATSGNFSPQANTTVVSAAPADASATGGRWAVSFTPRSGLAGWLQAKRAHLRLSGAGSIELTATRLRLRGWQRTWLGMPIEEELDAPLGDVRNVVQEESRICLDVRRPRRRWRFELTLASPEQARQLLSRLPAGQTPGFEQRWEARRIFERGLLAATPRIWVTPTIVGANIAVYLTLAVVSGHFWAMDPPHLIAWGANSGPLTLSGQWWRLLTAAFLHVSVLHIGINLWAFWNIGRLTERLYGNRLFLGVYLACAVLSSLGTLAWDSAHVEVGASGAIFGVFGAFLAYLSLRRTHVPLSIVRAHWLSTALFVLFSLINGFLQNGIDNAVHVCGLASGFVLGWLMARPVEVVAREPVTARRWAGIGTFIVVWVAASFWIIGGVGAPASASERYFQRHLWFVTGEAHDLASWQQALMQAQAGAASDAQLAHLFSTDIVPFWDATVARLKKESTPSDQQRIAEATLAYAQLRLDWARAVVAATSPFGQAHVQEAVRLSNETNLATARVQRIAMLDSAAHHVRSLSDSLWMNRLRRVVHLAPTCVKTPAVIHTPVGAHDSRTDGPWMAQAIACKAQADFLDKDFVSLERLLDLQTHPPGDLPDGSSTYSAALAGLDNLFLYGSFNPAQGLARLADWRRTRPKSVIPSLLEADLFEDWAWIARGYGTADTISGQGQLFFNGRVAMAAASLAELADRAKAQPLWYTLSIDLDVDQAQPVPKMRAVFDAGHARFPEYLQLDRLMLRVLMPRWYGSYKAVDDLITALYVDAAPERRFGTYARLYWIDIGLEGDDVDIFTATPVAWSVMEMGFEQLLMRYPASDYILNGYANVACRAGDKAQYQKLRQEVGHRFSASAWTSQYSLAGCDKRLGTPDRQGQQLRHPIPRTALDPPLRSIAGVILGMTATQQHNCGRCTDRRRE